MRGVCIPDSRRRTHIVAEALALAAVVPFAIYLTTRPTLPLWARLSAGALAAGSAVVDGVLLAAYLRQQKRCV